MHPFLQSLEQELNIKIVISNWQSLSQTALINSPLDNTILPVDSASLYDSLSGKNFLEDNVDQETFFQRRHRLQLSISHDQILDLAWKLLLTFYQNQAAIDEQNINEDIRQKLDQIIQLIYRQWELYIGQNYTPSSDCNEANYKQWLAQNNYLPYKPAYSLGQYTLRWKSKDPPKKGEILVRRKAKGLEYTILGVGVETILWADLPKSFPQNFSNTNAVRPFLVDILKKISKKEQTHLDYQYNRNLIMEVVHQKNRSTSTGWSSKISHFLSDLFTPSYNTLAVQQLLKLKKNIADPTVCNLPALERWWQDNFSWKAWLFKGGWKTGLFGRGYLGKEYRELKKTLQNNLKSTQTVFLTPDSVNNFDQFENFLHYHHLTDTPKEVDRAGFSASSTLIQKVQQLHKTTLATAEFTLDYSLSFTSLLNAVPNTNTYTRLIQDKTFLTNVLPNLLNDKEQLSIFCHAYEYFPDHNQAFLFYKAYKYFEADLHAMFNAKEDRHFMQKILFYLNGLQKQQPGTPIDIIYELYSQTAIYTQHIKAKNISGYSHGRLLEDSTLSSLLKRINKKIKAGKIDPNKNYKFSKRDENLPVSVQFVPANGGNPAYLKIHREGRIGKGSRAEFRLAQRVAISKNAADEYILDSTCLPFYVGRRVTERVKDSYLGDAQKEVHIEAQILGRNAVLQERERENKNNSLEVEKSCWPGETLYYYCEDANRLSTAELWNIMLQLLSQLQKLHNEGKYMHMDIKPENIIYDKFSGKAWLIDMDLATNSGEKFSGMRGTLEYMHPILRGSAEMIAVLETAVNNKIILSEKQKTLENAYLPVYDIKPRLDFWSLGIIFLELMGCIKFGRNIRNITYKDPDHDNNNLHVLIMGMMGISWESFKKSEWQFYESSFNAAKTATTAISALGLILGAWKTSVVTYDQIEPKLENQAVTTFLAEADMQAKSAPIPMLYQQISLVKT